MDLPFIKINYKILNRENDSWRGKGGTKAQEACGPSSGQKSELKKRRRTVEWFNVFLILILGSHMRLAKKEEEEFQGENSEVMPPKVSSGE